jgi:Ca2+-binding RTX toxin-like protein
MANFVGTSDDDQITGTEKADTINGRGGNDRIQGLGGDDTIIGGSGKDTIDSGLGDDVVHGGEGDDVLTDGGGADQLYGDAGDDQITLRRVYSDKSTVLVDGGEGDDTVYFTGPDADNAQLTIAGGAGDDLIRVSYASDVTVDGGEGDDNVGIFSSIETAVITGAGDDEVTISDARGRGSVDLGEGADRLALVIGFDPAPLTATLGAGQDTVRFGASDNQYFSPLSITDFATGAGGDAMDLAAYLSEVLSGWDHLNPFASGYLKLAQEKRDTLLQISFTGFEPFKTLVVFSDTKVAQFTAENFGGWSPTGGGLPGETIRGTNGDDLLMGSSADDKIDGRGGDDRLFGFGGDDRLNGGVGADHLDGGAGSDVVKGGDGDDEIVDDQGGADRLYGDAGNDAISVMRAEGGQSGRVVADGGVGDDVLSLSWDLDGLARATLRGGADDDYLEAYMASRFTLDGGDGDDIIRVTACADTTVTGGAGDDFVAIASPLDGLVVVDLGKGNDILSIDVTGAAAPEYVLTLGAGRDLVDFNAVMPEAQPSVRIIDFKTGAKGDTVDVADWLSEILLGWDGTDPFAGGYLQWVQSGADAQLQVDLDGGADSWSVLLTFDNTTTSAFGPDNLIVIPSAGSMPASVSYPTDDASDWLLL